MRFALQPRMRRFVCIALAILCAAWCMPQSASAQDVADATIPLASLGYEPAPAHLLLAQGYSISSLHYVDAHHLLFTYNKRSLIKRMPDDSPDAIPQNVAAILLEIPSGKVVARAEWRLHDHAQYLWPIGEGTFLLRTGRELRLLTPLAGNDEGALQGKTLMTLPGQVVLIAIAPDGRMVLVEADVSKPAAAADPAAPATQVLSPLGTPLGEPPAAPQEDHTTDVQFLEFDLSRQAQGAIKVNRLAHITSPSPLVMPLTHEGYIHAAEFYPDDWNLIYTQLNGKDTVLGDVVSTCRPGAAFLSNNEILVETCNGNDTALILTVVTLGKKELWQQKLDDAATEPVLHTTPGSGRFAVSRILLNGVASPGVDLTAETDVRMQRIDVMDIENGALVASVVAAPAQRTAQNFSLSADGRHLAVLQKDAIALYDLAPMQDFPAAKIKPNDMIFVAAPEGAVASRAPVVAPAVIEVPLNVDARRAPPTLLTPDEQRSVEGKKNKQITIQPIAPPPDPKKHPKDQQDQQPQQPN